MNMESEVKSVCVVGLGPAGLCSVKELRQHGFQVTGIDAGTHIGGRWALDEWNPFQNRHFGVWNELCLNCTRPLMEFSDFPWNKQDYVDKPGVKNDLGGQFPHSTEAKAYLEAYAAHFDLLAEGIEMETFVEAIERGPDGTGWIVVTKTASTTTDCPQSIQRRKFDFVVCCLGLHAIPKNPLLKDDGSGALNGFSGTVLHSSEVRSLSEMDDKRVLVLGSSVSGAELSSSLASRGHCRKITNSVQNVPYVLDRFSVAENKTLDHLIYNRLLVYFNRYLPDSTNANGFKSLVEKCFPEQLTEEITGDAPLVPHEKYEKALATVCSDYVKYVKEGNLQMKLEVCSSHGNKVTFKDGSTDEFDVIICGTGYAIDLSLLPEDVRESVSSVNPLSGTVEVALYKYTLVPGWNDIAFGGLSSLFGPFFPTAEMQARYISKVFKGDIPRPTDAQLKAGVEKFKSFRAAGAHHAIELSTVIQEDIGDELGVTPSIPTTLWNSKQLLFGTLFPCYYRTNAIVDGQKVARKAQALFDWYMTHPEEFIRKENTY